MREQSRRGAPVSCVAEKATFWLMMMMMMGSVLRSVLQHAKGLIDDLYLSYSRYVFSTEVDAQDGMALGCQAVREVLTQGYSPWPCKLSTVTAWCAGAGTSLLSESWLVANSQLRELLRAWLRKSKFCCENN